MFNQLIIIGGAILASPGQRMILDPRALIRDVGFYAVTIVVLVLVFVPDLALAPVRVVVLMLVWVRAWHWFRCWD